MRYLLAVGFCCDIYRQEPKARIFFNNKLLDEFYVNQFEDTWSMIVHNKKNHILAPIPRKLVLSKFYDNIPLLHIYEIEIKNAPKKVEIQIQIENNDNNYTNGFISKSTLLQLRVFYFFPLNSKINNILSDKGKKFNFFLYNWQSQKPYYIFDLTSCTKWIGNTKKIPANSRMSVTDIGGDGFFTCELFKKYGIFLPPVPPRYPKKSRMITKNTLMKFILDKYKSHEDK
jgi:hypothetical protein